jgi:hypothetical protein
VNAHPAAPAGTRAPVRSEARPLAQLLPGAAGLLYAATVAAFALDLLAEPGGRRP